MSFLTDLQNVLAANNKVWLAQVLNGAGLGLVSYQGLSVFSDYYADKVQMFPQVDVITGILGLAGFDEFVNSLIAAYLASVYISTFATGLRVVKK